MSEDPATIAINQQLTAPRVASFCIPDSTDYFLFLEATVVTKISMDFSKALIIWFVSHYIFNLEYETNIRECALFFEEFLFGLDSSSHEKKTSNYLSMTTNIVKNKLF